MRQRTRQSRPSRVKAIKQKGGDETATYHYLINVILPVVRGVIGGACVYALGIILRATDGVLHAPKTVRQVGYISYFTTFVLSVLLEPNGEIISSSLIAISLFLIAAAQPLYASVLTSCATAITTPKTSAITRILSSMCFILALQFSTFQPWYPLQNCLFLICLIPHISGSKSPSKRHGKSFTRRFISLAIIASTCFIALPSIGSQFVPAIPSTHKLVAHQRGATGLISVLDDLRNQYRLLIADHSILGGRFTAQEYIHETIFGQFHVHEAVRLTEGPGNDAVCIGVGIGVVAQALHDHGVKVDAVELDGVVAKFAKKYFGLHGPNVIVDDAAVWLENAKSNSYDYAVHDVFTGGAIAPSMFELNTFHNIHRVLRSDGVLALNFVGDISGGEATRALSAIRARLSSVWKFVDMYGEDTNATVVNIVYFASDNLERLKFRDVTWSDALGSTVRMGVLESFRKRKIGDDVIPSMSIDEATDDVVNKGQWITAKKHWTAMRGILHKNVWIALSVARDTSFMKAPRWRKRRK